MEPRSHAHLNLTGWILRLKCVRIIKYASIGFQDAAFIVHNVSLLLRNGLPVWQDETTASDWQKE